MKKIFLIALLAITLPLAAWAELTSEIVVDKVEVVGPYRHVQVRMATVITDDMGTPDTADDVEIARKFHRYVLAADTDLTGQPAEVQAVAGAVHTPDVKARWAEKKQKDKEIR